MISYPVAVVNPFSFLSFDNPNCSHIKQLSWSPERYAAIGFLILLQLRMFLFTLMPFRP